MSISDRFRHFFHVVSNIRPIVWMGLYIVLIPIFALIYWGIPDGQFRIPDGGGTDFGSWLYYSIVTITTLGFGDYTPAHGIAQGVTAAEVTCGLLVMGFFLNSVGSMKSEIDVASEVEKQRRLHQAAEKDKLVKSAPVVIHNINSFLDACYDVTTPTAKRTEDGTYDADFTLADMKDMYQPGAAGANPAVAVLLKSASRLSLALDSMQTRIDLTPWPKLLEDAFAFVANYQMFSSADALMVTSASEEARKSLSEKLAAFTASTTGTNDPQLAPAEELAAFIKENAAMATRIETILSTITSPSAPTE